jgi:hypothetical protein
MTAGRKMKHRFKQDDQSGWYFCQRCGFAKETMEVEDIIPCRDITVSEINRGRSITLDKMFDQPPPASPE